MKEDFETLQKNYNIVSQQKEDISKYNLALQDQVTKYSLLLKDEKDEKKEILNKYD